MKAVQASAFGDSSVLSLVELPSSEPGPGEIRVRVHAAGVNPVEVYIRNGGYAAYDPGLPYVPGFDAAGVVDAVGAGVDCAVGDRVFVASRDTGTYAEYVVADASSVWPLPAGVSFAQGASLGIPGLAAHRALFERGGLKAGEQVLVHGASGAVGYLAVQLARAAGASVIGTAGSDEGLAAVRDLGVPVVDHRAPDQYDQIKALTGGHGVDLIVEMLANENLVDDFTCLATFGRIVVVGNRGALEFNPRLVMGKDADIRGVANWNASPAARATALGDLAAKLADGSLVPRVGREFPLAEAAAAQDYVMTSKALGKVVLTIG
ncbi:NADPH:quinone reductase [Propioniciclava tarda]|uniref:NADPH:quinone reductase n=1 Tax=Propioniciclava tarda TaxID=433330 RepID=A0A4V2JSW8_PROTD|nr:NADPH:quinone reductase [Propioniciclava tarda]TBT92191.1 NADPH:quinone reductase [Propioniciclava tarda]SMO82151.1 NADPH2:quinone reductase [Propioniciclava tarda]